MKAPADFDQTSERSALGSSPPPRESRLNTRAEQLHAVLGGRLAKNLFEDAIKMCQRLKTDLKSDFTDAQVGIQQKVLGLLDPDARQIIGEVDAGNLLEHLAEIKSAGE